MFVAVHGCTFYSDSVLLGVQIVSQKLWVSECELNALGAIV